MNHELSPDLLDVRDRFIANYVSGGVPAVERNG